jgi:predicted DNA-binding transcriptional regulator AlpA
VQNSNSFHSATFEPFVDAERAALFLDMRRKTLLELVRKGKLPGHPIGSGQRRMWKFRISELEQWMISEVNSTQRLRPASRRIS